MNGYGTLEWNTGSIYTGLWKNNDMHGQGVYTYRKESNLDRYEGNFKNDNFDGLGTLYWKNGDRYEGNFVKGQQNGFGIKYAANGSIIYKGEWKNGKLVTL